MKITIFGLGITIGLLIGSILRERQGQFGKSAALQECKIQKDTLGQMWDQQESRIQHLLGCIHFSDSLSEAQDCI